MSISVSGGLGARGASSGNAPRTRVKSESTDDFELLNASGLPLLFQHGVPVLPDHDERMRRTRLGKRLLDLALAVPALITLAPTFVAVALAVRLTSPGPIFFRQPRVGYQGTNFEIIKFRTLRTECADPTGVDQVSDGCRRFTPIGDFLRRTSLDELPQLINVIRGEMSLVGPRPQVAGQLAAGVPYEEMVPYYRLRTLAKPGLTGWAQANGLRGSTEDPTKAMARIEHDLAYIQNLSVVLDVRTILKTLRQELLNGLRN